MLEPRAISPKMFYEDKKGLLKLNKFKGWVKESQDFLTVKRYFSSLRDYLR